MNFRNKNHRKKLHFIRHKLINAQNFNLIVILNQMMKFRLIDIFKIFDIFFFLNNEIPFFKFIKFLLFVFFFLYNNSLSYLSLYFV